MRRALLIFTMLSLACGPDLARRPIELEVEGLSGRADRLVIKIFPKSSGVLCAEVTMMNVQGLEAPHTEVWERGTEARMLSFEPLDVDAITLIAYAEDASNQPIQLACAQIEYLDVESPSQTLDLTGS